MAEQGARDQTRDEAASSANPSVLGCPGCHQPTDPDINQCEHCGYLHLGWLVPVNPSEPTSPSEPLADRFGRQVWAYLRGESRGRPAGQPGGSESPQADGHELPQSEADGQHRLVGFLNRNEQGIGGIYVSLISAAVLCGGLLLHGHFEPHKKLCESGVGAFAQETSSSALKHCSLDSFLAEVGTVIAIFSGLMLGVGLFAVVLTAIAAGQRRSASGE